MISTLEAPIKDNSMINTLEQDYNKLVKIIAKRVSSFEKAKELVADLYIKFNRNNTTYSPSLAVFAAVNLHKDKLRRRNCELKYAYLAGIETDKSTELNDFIGTTVDLSVLTKRNKAVVESCLELDFNWKAIARRHKITTTTVHQHLRNAIIKLRQVNGITGINSIHRLRL